MATGVGGVVGSACATATTGEVAIVSRFTDEVTGACGVERTCGGTEDAEISRRDAASSIGSGTGRAGTTQRGSSGESGKGGASFNSDRALARSSSGNGRMMPGRGFDGVAVVDSSRDSCCDFTFSQRWAADCCLSVSSGVAGFAGAISSVHPLGPNQVDKATRAAPTGSLRRFGRRMLH